MIRKITRTTILLLALIPVMGFKIMPVEYIRTKVKIDNIIILPILTELSDINRNNEFEPNATLSNSIFEKTTTLFKTYFPDTVKQDHFYPDSIQKNTINNAITRIISRINTNHKAKTFKIPDSLIKVFAKTQSNYVFCLSNIGFIRTNENMKKQYVEGQTLSYISPLINFFSNVPTPSLGFKPYKSSSLMTAFIIDLKNKNILYFKSNIGLDRDPSDEIVIKSQLNDLIKSYFM